MKIKKTLYKAVGIIVMTLMIAATGRFSNFPAKAAEGEVHNVKDYKGSGSAAIQNAINACPTGGTVYIPEGTYTVVATIHLKSGITIRGDGEKTILKASPLLSTSTAVMANPNAPNGVDKYGDSNITIRELSFSGSNITGRTGALLSLTKAQGINVINCSFRYNRGISVAVGGSKDVTVKNSTFEGNGLPKPSKISSPAFWTDSALDNPAKNIVLEGCLFQNNTWSGAYFMPQGGKISGCTFIDNGESSIFTNQFGSDIQYINNYISGGRSSNISASGIEIGASNSLVEGNLIRNSGDSGISLTNLKNVVLRNNLIINNGQETQKFPHAAGIGILSLEIWPNQYSPQDITITNNTIGNNPSMAASQNAAVSFWKSDQGEAADRMTISGNIFGTMPFGGIRFLSNKSTTLGKDSNFTGNTENQVVTQKIEDDFTKALNERIAKVREGANPPPAPITSTSSLNSSGANSSATTNPPSGTDSTSSDNSDVSSSDSTSDSTGNAPDNSGNSNASDGTNSTGGTGGAKKGGINPFVIALIIIAAGLAGVGIGFLVLKKTDNKSAEDTAASTEDNPSEDSSEDTAAPTEDNPSEDSSENISEE